MTRFYTDKSGAYIGGFDDGAVPPEGSIEHSEPPHGRAVWTDNGWVVPFDPVKARQTASLTKREFCLALYRAGILQQEDAIAAAKGEWPEAMAGFLSYMTPDQATDAQIEWGGATVIERTNPIVLTLASWLSLPDEQVDKIFGIAG